MVTIRPETPADQAATHHVNTAAFGRPAEADLVDTLRRQDALTLSLVAEQDGQVVGHIAFSPVRITGDQDSFEALALGPMAVLPAQQGQGTGSQLVRSALAALKEKGATIVFVLGHRTYYPRFGFEPAQRYGIGCEFDVPPEFFMVCALREGVLQESQIGEHSIVYYQPAFRNV